MLLISNYKIFRSVKENLILFWYNKEASRKWTVKPWIQPTNLDKLIVAYMGFFLGSEELNWYKRIYLECKKSIKIFFWNIKRFFFVHM